MNYNNGDDELERMRERSRRGTRQGPGKSGSFASRQEPSRRTARASGTRDFQDEGEYPDDDYYDQEYSQEEYGHNEYAREYDEEEYGFMDDGFDDEALEYEPENSRRGRRSHVRTQAPSSRSSRSASGSNASSKGKKSSRTGSRTADNSQQQRGKGMNKDSRGRNRDASMGPGQGQMAKQRKKKRWRFKGILLILLAAVVGYGAWLFLQRPTGIWNVAVFGVDSRDGNTKNALADVQMICSINRSTGEIKLVSVYRDTYLKINAKGTYHKINEAYFKGGHKQAVDALEENLDLKIDDYATFNWKSVAEAINILGGIDIDITPAEFKYINAFITETVNSTGIGSVQLKQPGPNHLDGVQAVAYSRLRLMDTDFQRTERQRKVIMLALEKAKEADLSTLTSLVTSLIPQISTSVSPSDVLPLVKDIKKYHIGETAGFPFSRQTKRVGRMDCVIPTTLESNVIQLHQFLYGDKTSYSPSSAVKKISARISEETGLYEEGKTAPLGGGSKDSSPDKGKTPAKTAPAKEKEPETTAPEPSLPEESTQESSEETTESATVPVDEYETETGEIGPGIPTKPSVNPDSTKGESEDAGPGAGGSEKPSNKPTPSPGSETTSSPTNRPTHSPSTGPAENPGGNPGANGSNPGQTGSGDSGPGEVGPGV